MYIFFLNGHANSCASVLKVLPDFYLAITIETTFYPPTGNMEHGGRDAKRLFHQERQQQGSHHHQNSGEWRTGSGWFDLAYFKADGRDL